MYKEGTKMKLSKNEIIINITVNSFCYWKIILWKLCIWNTLNPIYSSNLQAKKEKSYKQENCLRRAAV